MKPRQSLISYLIKILLVAGLFSEILNSQPTRYDDSNLMKMWGLEILFTDSGFGAGGFYWREFSPTVSGFLGLSVAESKDKRELEFINPWTGQKIVPGKLNRFLVIPLYAGFQYRVFKEHIVDNFRPFVTAAIGPTMIYAIPFEGGFFRNLSRGKAYHTAGGYIGLGAYVGSSRTNVTGISFRYYFVPYRSGILSMYDPETELDEERVYWRKTQFGGFVLSLNFGIGR